MSTVGADASPDPRLSGRRSTARAAAWATDPPSPMPLRGVGAIQGDLAAYALPDLLQFLNGLRKDGQLVIERAAPLQSASLAFVEGRLVHAYCTPLQGEECLHYLLTWASGRFIFLAEATTDRETIRRDFRTVLLDAVRQHDEFQQVLHGLPPLSTVFHRDRQQDRLEEAMLSHAHWRALMWIDGVSTLGELIDRSPRQQLELTRSLGTLLALGLISVRPDYEYLAMIVLRSVVGASELPDQAEPILAAAVLSRCDGSRTLMDLQQELQCHPSALIDAIEGLYQGLALELVRGQMEFERFFVRL
jgi:hypothetical protein